MEGERRVNIRETFLLFITQIDYVKHRMSRVSKSVILTRGHPDALYMIRNLNPNTTLPKYRHPPSFYKIKLKLSVIIF